MPFFVDKWVVAQIKFYCNKKFCLSGLFYMVKYEDISYDSGDDLDRLISSLSSVSAD